jgi:N-acylneuraminate cytidylyltransferase
MIANKRVLAVIAARGGSKGLPRKNLADLCGQPLIAWSIAAAKGSNYLDRIIFSSEDEELMAAARQCGCEVPFRRPSELATDEASIIDVIFHAIDTLGESFDLVVLLQAASPLRLPCDIDGALETLVRAKAPACVSVTTSGKPPFWTYLLDDQERLVPLLPAYAKATRRQDLPETFVLNGAIFAAEIPWLRETRKFVGPDTVAWTMPQDRSIDIDSESDLAMARWQATRMRERYQASMDQTATRQMSAVCRKP